MHSAANFLLSSESRTCCPYSSLYNMGVLTDVSFDVSYILTSSSVRLKDTAMCALSLNSQCPCFVTVGASGPHDLEPVCLRIVRFDVSVSHVYVTVGAFGT